jgi:hypothetical protein
MENRYSFGGFIFGMEKNLFQLTIKQLKENGYGHNIELGFELTHTERLELINLLISMNAKDSE